MNIERDDPNIIVINPDAAPGGCGTFEEPFSTIEEGLRRVAPGQTILLCGGDYAGDLNIEVSGTARRPIRIIAEPGAKVIVRGGCWFFYDTEDLIVSGLTFIDAPYGAISVIGECSRNIFDSLRFINCGLHKGASCTLYIGGSGGACNIIENCVFEHAPVSAGRQPVADEASVGLMVAQGDISAGRPIVKTLLRRNRFVNYSYGIIIGGDESKSVRCGHIVEYNTISNCTNEGILIKSGDTMVRGNIIEKSDCNALLLLSELDCTVERNRIVDCRCGIVAAGSGHTISDNCLIRCSGGAIRVGRQPQTQGRAATNCFIERNTFINCGSALSKDDSVSVAGVMIDHGASGILEKNLIFGKGKPYAVVQESVCSSGETDLSGNSGITRFVIRDNAASGGCETMDGIRLMPVEFADIAADDYSNDCGVGASGWVLRPEGFDPLIDEEEDSAGYREAGVLEDEEGNLLIPDEETDCAGLLGSFFAGLFGEEGETENPPL